jgi:hypothetical protein
MGYNYLYDMYNMHERDSNWKSYHFDYHSSPFLDPEEIERIRHSIDPLKFAREYLANFEDSGNSVFYCFDRKTHVTREIPMFQQATQYSKMDGEDVHVAIDFNVGKFCMPTINTVNSVKLSIETILSQARKCTGRCNDYYVGQKSGRSAVKLWNANSLKCCKRRTTIF